MVASQYDSSETAGHGLDKFKKNHTAFHIIMEAPALIGLKVKDEDIKVGSKHPRDAIVSTPEVKVEPPSQKSSPIDQINVTNKFR